MGGVGWQELVGQLVAKRINLGFPPEPTGTHTHQVGVIPNQSASPMQLQA